MEKKKETKRFDLMEFGSALGREEMKKLMAGSWGTGNCYVQLSCPGSGPIAQCWGDPEHHSGGTCYTENDGTCEGYINCNVGQEQYGCWEFGGPCGPG